MHSCTFSRYIQHIKGGKLQLQVLALTPWASFPLRSEICIALIEAGSGHGQVSDKSEGTAVSGRSERCRGLLWKGSRLKLLWKLIFTVSYTTYWQIPRLCKFLCPLKWLRPDNETTLCVLMCTITQRTEEILQAMWETKTNTGYMCCKLCLKLNNPWSKPMEHALYPLFICLSFDSV